MCEGDGEGWDRPRHRDGSAAAGAKGWIGRAKGWLAAENDLLVGFFLVRVFFAGGLRVNGGGRMTKKSSENKPQRLFIKSSIRSRDFC